MQRSLFSLDKPPAASTRSSSPVSRAYLNEAQYEAATTMDGPVLVIAGAGSGKTRTLVYRLAHLVEQGVSPEQILLLTFTRKAAQEMVSRASLLLDDSCRRVMGGTFHAVANLLLRRHAHHLGYGANFTILDQADAEGIVNLIKSSLNLGGESKRFPSKRLIVAILSKAVNKGLSIADLLDEEYGHLHDYLDDLLLIRDHYQKFKLEHGLMDYDDLLVNWQRLLTEQPAVREELSGRFAYLMVDEYQDTNPIQAEIVRLMAAPRNNVMVVGDDSQSIYSFRGADFRNIMDFPRLFPGSRIIRLEENYRSTQPILSLTNAIIERAQEKYTKTLFSKIESADRPVVHAARDESAQARYVVEKILELQGEGVPLSEMAVLFRSGYHSFKLELELTNRHLDFEKRGGLKLTESAHIKDVLSYLRIVVNPQDHLSWNRLLLQLDKVGPKTAQNVLSRIKSADDPLAALRSYPAGKSWQLGLTALIDLLDSLAVPGLSPVAQFDLVMDHYQPAFERLYHDDYPRRSRDLEQLRAILEGYSELQPFLDDTSLDPPQAEQGNVYDAGERERLVLSTIHSAKGLEWDVVFIIHLVEGKFPSAQAALPEQFEEERRLLYVAATRARKRLFFLYPREVMSPDRFRTTGAMSPFLEELPPNLMESGREKVPAWQLDPWKNEPVITPPAYQPATVASTAPERSGDEELVAGMAVKHPFFGQGKVERKVGPRTFDIYFPRHGRKTLHLDYARLEVLS
ncbi:MAG: ATP-dependent helicase [Thermodesulfobacteriota bacterium]